MKLSALFLVLCLSFQTVSADIFHPLIDSAHSVALSGKVTDGKLRIRPQDADKAAILVREQLHYLVGFLNGYRAGADMSKAKITLKGIRPLSDELSEVQYDTDFTVAWPRSSQAPAVLATSVPSRSDSIGKEAFFASYGSHCQSGEEPADAYSFFYYYRPQKQGCELWFGYDSTAVPIRFALSPSPLQTKNKFPEYDQVWKDGQLALTFLVGTYADGATSSQDQGVQSYNGLFQTLRRYFGTPTWSNVQLSASQAPGLRYPDIEMHFRYSGNRIVNLNLLLIQKSSLQHPSQKFLQRYSDRTKISDLVAYNGHSGLGANIRALSRLGTFVEGHYQIFFVNGCDTFTYVDNTLETAVAAVNPGSAGSKYLDLIVNAMPSPFSGFSRNALAIAGGLLNQKNTYRQILSGFAQSQYALVTGEEDNTFTP